MDTVEATVTATNADNGATIDVSARKYSCVCSRGDFSSTTNEKRQAYMHIMCGILASDWNINALIIMYAIK